LKLLVVGQANVGKTSLCQALKNQKTNTANQIAPPLATDGIEIEPLLLLDRSPSLGAQPDTSDLILNVCEY
jgi:GTPase SAR1 family protein